MVDQTTALWVALIGFGIWIGFADLRPFWLSRRREPFPESHAETCRELAKVLGDVRYQVVSYPLWKEEDKSGQQIASIEYRGAFMKAVKLAAQIAYDTETYDAVGDYLKRCNDLWVAETGGETIDALVLDLAEATGPLMKALQSGQGVKSGAIPEAKGRLSSVGEQENAATV